jgi:hypothetical protein
MHTERFVLPDHLRLCRTHRDTVCLDLRRNRYYSLGARETQVLQRCEVLACEPAPRADSVDTSLSPAEFEWLTHALTEAGILARADGRPVASPTAIPAQPLSSAADEQDESAPLRWHHVTSMVRASAWARYALRARSLLAVAQALQQARGRTGPRDIEQQVSRVLELTHAFRALRPFFYGARDRCLLHALTLTHFLALYGLYPAWVIGVRTRPWGAHSWVQWGSLLLDGRPDDVYEYTPILVA